MVSLEGRGEDLFGAGVLRRQSRLLVDGLIDHEGVVATAKVLGGGTLEELVDLGGELAIVGHLSTLSVLGTTVGLNKLPLSAHVSDLGTPVGLRVVGLGKTTHALPEGQVGGVDGDTMVLALLALDDVVPAALLLLEVEAGGVGEEEPGEEHTSETEPGDDVELGLVIDVVVKDRGEEGTRLADAGGEAVGGGTDGSGENLTGDEEGDRVGAELVEEGRDEVHGLEAVDTGRARVVIVLEGGDDEHEEAHEEANLLHVLAAVHLVVNEERSKVVSAHGDSDVDQVPGPGGEDGVVGARDDVDELRLEELVAVEEDIVAEPSAGSGKETATEVSETVSEGVQVVAGNVGSLLSLCELLGGVGHAVGTVVEKPESADGGEGEGETEGVLSSRGRVRGRALALVEDGEEDNEDDLVDELTPALHQEGGGDTAATVQTILTSRELAVGGGTLERRCSSDGILATDTETVEEERPGVADDPALKGETPAGSEHEKTDEHDGSILDETPASADPITHDL